MHLGQLIRSVPDYPKKGILFYDITPLLGNGEAFQQCIDNFYSGVSSWQPTKILSPEARGFIFGAPLAMRLSIGFVPVRKPGKLPGKTRSVSYTLEYGTNTLNIPSDALSSQDRVLLVDDVLATGGTIHAMRDLVVASGAQIVGCAVLLELDALHGRENLDMPLHTLLHV